MYDYNNGRFLSVDPFIQAPTSTQSMNPYTYIFNNPLSGTDPSGYLSEIQNDALIDAMVEFEGVSNQEARQAVGASQSGALIAVAGFIDTGSDLVAPIKKLMKEGVKQLVKQSAKQIKKALKNGNKNKQQSSKNTSSSDVSDTESQDFIKSTSEIRGKGDFKKGKIEADKRSPETCEYCGKHQEKPEGDHFNPLNEAKEKVNKGEMTKQEAIDKYDSKDNFVNSCTNCNRGKGQKHGKQPSTKEGKGKWVPPKPNEHVTEKLKQKEG